MFQAAKIIADEYSDNADAVFAQGDSLDILRECPAGFAKLIITSPPLQHWQGVRKAKEVGALLGGTKADSRTTDSGAVSGRITLLAGWKLC
jgi:hypothetical protein